MRPYILADCNWKNIKDRSIELAVLPWGATEAHNYHLPYSSDVIESDHIAAESAKMAYDKGAKIIVLPTIPFGVNTGQIEIKLDLNIYPSTQYAIIHDLVEVLNYQKIYKLIVMNSHGGNDFKQILREVGLKFPKMFLCCCNWYNSIDKLKYFDHNGDHADEMETSMLLYLANDLVLPLDQAGDGVERKIKIKSLQESWVWTERKWSYATEDTGIGYPKDATKEKGERYFNAVVEKMSQLFLEIAQADLEDLYE
jgi:creatinine amidohydrolase